MKQVFTFGCGQVHDGKYIVISGKSKAGCRKKMFDMFGQKWAFQYNNKEDAGVERFNLVELK